MEEFPVAALCARLGLTGPVERFPEGSLPVYAVGEDLVLKLYPPGDAAEARTETLVLRALDGRLPVPTPAVVGEGEWRGWWWLLMSRLHGESLASAWPRLSTPERAGLATSLGETLAALHAVDDPALTELEPRDWAGFVAARRGVVAAEQRELGLDERWLRQLPDFLDAVDLGEPEPVLLHTEFMREHVLLRHDGKRWHVSGLLDFEPAMRGAAEYDLVAAGVFLAGGDTRFLRSLLLGYGYSPAALDVCFARRCLAYTLLHRYANLAGYLRRLPAPPEPTLDALARTWFLPAGRD
ncbi:phosphotransferase family protein [Prauserella muralis]|uniref:Aminoglycoside phosphotransferase n=1 Tax=Prauserella muralis TaxID=588067 RepID=A0A2V4AYP7_9PSEU|nr:aminoglycoside 3'-phosphotransferase/choline kinase family protein [Prauserella muralis]PXY27012.1 aminoglycoside phosphotransferase [Prauserella muralis]TWE23366.1 hygromycin-B 7''-O-kinase [Prauserella muralis]